MPKSEPSGQVTSPTTFRTRLKLAFTTFQTTTFTAPAPTTTEPSAGIYFDTKRNQVVFTLLGVGTAAQTVKGLLLGWYLHHESGVYVSIALLKVTGTLSSQEANIGGQANAKFCETLTVAVGEGVEGSAMYVSVTKASEGGVAWVIVDNPGVEYVTFQVDKDTATSANVLAGSY